MSYKHITLSNNGVIENRISVNDDGELVTRDIMSGRNVQQILDDNQRVRNDAPHNKKAQGVMAARIPLPLFHTWKKEWKKVYKQDMTWHQFLIRRINDRDYGQLRTQDKKIILPENLR